MSTISIGARLGANPESGETCTSSGTARHLNFTIAQCLRVIFPRKTWLRLIELTGLSERTAKYRMSGERDFSASELAAFMSAASPRWWVQVQSAFKLGAMRRHRQQLQEAINEAERLGDTLARAETAFGVCDADFHRPQVDALGTIRSDLYRPLARKR